MRSLFRSGAWGCAFAVLAFAPLALGVAPAQGQVVATPVKLTDTVLPQLAHATLQGHYNAEQPIRVILALKFPNPQAIEAYNEAILEPASPLFRQFLTPEEIGKRFGPAQADYDAVVNHLKSNGMNVIGGPANHITVWAYATVPQVESAFGVKMNVYKESVADAIARAGNTAVPQMFFSNDREVTLPASIAPHIEAVDGLQNYTHPILLFKKAKKAPSAPFAPADVRTAYNNAPLYNGGDTGSGRTLGISNWDGLNLTNAGDFVTKFTLPTTLSGGKPTNVTIDAISSTSTSGEGEGDLDVQMMLGQAPLATIVVYSDPEGSSPLAVLSAETSANAADLISESYGWSLSASVISSCHTQHTMMTTQGQTYFCASGDSGSSIGNYYYPDADPNITVVGGTTLTLSSTGARSSEPGWADSGGGYSSKAGFAKPTWQVGTGVPSTNYRLFPDVSSNANGSKGAYQFYYKGKDATGYVGTSFASPVTTAMFAEVEQYMIGTGKLTKNSAGKYRLGNINSYLYTYIGTANVYNVTSGSNGSYKAGTGWDYVTGVGTLNFDNVANALP